MRAVRQIRRMQANALRLSHREHGAVIVAVAAMRMMQMVTHEVIDVIAMGDGIMSAVFAVHMGLRVCRALMGRCARIRIAAANGNFAFVYVIFVGMVQVSVVEVIDVVAMSERRMPAIRTMNVGVFIMCFVLMHRFLLFRYEVQLA
jgi:hypothetical protein